RHTPTPPISALSLHDALPIFTVNSIAPGLILDTPFHAQFTPPEDQQRTIASIPVGRPGYPDDVASAAEYLARTDAGFVTGTVLRSEEHTSELQSRENLVCRLL